MTCSTLEPLALPEAELTTAPLERMCQLLYIYYVKSNTGVNRPSETRQFNTSRGSKAVNDSSTLDFVYMPSIASLESQTSAPQRIPILGEQYYIPEGSTSQVSASPMKPQIHAISETASDMSASPMSEVVDNYSLEIDPFKLTETVGRSRAGENEKKLSTGGQPEKGIIGELFSGMVDDLLRPNASSSGAARK